jgi:hypothetical protein
MDSKERVMCALAGEQPDRVPFCSPAGFREFMLPAMQRSAEAINIPWIFQ